MKVATSFDLRSLPGDPASKTALLVNPPVYDTQYWAEWAQPYGLLRIGALLRQHGYRRVLLYDFMETSPNGKRVVPKHRINWGESYAEGEEPTRPTRPYAVEKAGDRLDLFKFHFGKPWHEFDEWLAQQGLVSEPPDEVFVSATMTYWWEPARDLVARLRRRFPKARIILGGIYPTLVPEHAARHVAPDLVVAGEVVEANDLWTDLSLYERPPSYAVITPSRGCPYNCSYCAQRTINGGRRAVHCRQPDDVLAEMRHKYETHGIQDFSFYADFPLWRFEENLQPVLERIVADKLPFRFYAPEGFDVRLLSQSQRFVDLMKQAGFQKLYLPCESIDEEYVRGLNRGHVTLDHFVKAVRMCEQAGFELRNMDVNGFVLYGLPGENLDSVVKTALFVSELTGSIIPMLFAPVPSTALYERHLPYFRQRGWDERLEMLNGKLYPFLQMNEGSLADYVDLQRLMYMLNSHYRSQSFRIFGDSRVSRSLRANVSNGFEQFVRGKLAD